MNLSPGRIFSFTLLVIIGGLTQFWVAILVFLFTSDSTAQFSGYITILFRDGGLFFFGTSLCYSSLLTLVAANPISVGSTQFNISIPVVSIVTAVAIVGYMTFETGPLAFPSGTYSLQAKVLAQLSVAAIAIVYAFYTAAESKFFRRTS